MMTKLYPVVKRLPTPHARLFAANAAPAGALSTPAARPLPLPEVSYVDWSEWERAAVAFGLSPALSVTKSQRQAPSIVR